LFPKDKRPRVYGNARKEDVEVDCLDFGLDFLDFQGMLSTFHLADVITYHNGLGVIVLKNRLSLKRGI
jgi:hypothetical protein